MRIIRRAAALFLWFSLSSCGVVEIQIDANPPIFQVGIEVSEETIPPSLTLNSTQIPLIPSAAQWTLSVTPTYTLPTVLTWTPSASPTSMPTVTNIAAGGSHACAVTSGGELWCWGKNEHGQLGDGTTTDRTVPVRVSGLDDVRAVTAGWGHTCALRDGGGVRCWGYNRNGELGNGTTADSSHPVDVDGLTGGVSAIVAGDDHTCALTDGGKLICWGYNATGQLGDGTAINGITPVEVAGIPGGISAVATGWGHTCALSDQGGVLCWGDNEYGQLGDGIPVTYRTWSGMVTDLEFGVTAISASGGYTCALTDRGGVLCWGNNKYGQLGDGTSQDRPIPGMVSGLYAGISGIASGRNHSCALTGSGGMMCWGRNYYGQLGDGTTITRTTPVNTAGLKDRVTKISAGNDFTCALTAGGRVICWGENEQGQLGDGTRENRSAPTDVFGL